MMGNKSAARQLMIDHGVPVVPGSQGSLDTPEEAQRIADEIGYPVLLKAAAGGGGRGMRRVFSREELIPNFEAARAEAVPVLATGKCILKNWC